MNLVRLIPMVVWVAVAVPACINHVNVQCGQDSDCNLSPGGLCTAVAGTTDRWCAFPDLTCGPDGYRYSTLDVGDGVSGVCVPMISASCKRRVAFADYSRKSDLDQPGEVWIASLDGAELINLSNNSTADDGHPNWSPNGRKVAFESNRTGNYDIFVVNADGSGLVNVTPDSTGANHNPVWSPDGLRIAFTRNGELWVMNANGSGAAQISMLETFELAWSPAGNELVFVHFDSVTGVPGLYIVTVGDGSPAAKLTSSASREIDPTWAPATKIIFSNSSDIFTAKDDGSNIVNVTQKSTPRTGDPKITHDGTVVVFDSDHGMGNELWRISSGESAKQLTYISRAGQESFLVEDVSDDGLLVSYRYKDTVADATAVGIVGIDGANPHTFNAPGGVGAFGARFSPSCGAASPLITAAR